MMASKPSQIPYLASNKALAASVFSSVKYGYYWFITFAWWRGLSITAQAMWLMAGETGFSETSQHLFSLTQLLESGNHRIIKVGKDL